MPMIPAGQRDRKIFILRPVMTKNTYNEDIEGAPIEFTRTYARVRYGTAQEKREAAQLAGAQTATFECVSTSKLRQVALTDRISFDNAVWNINEVAPLDRYTMRFTAVRNR